MLYAFLSAGEAQAQGIADVTLTPDPANAASEFNNVAATVTLDLDPPEDVFSSAATVTFTLSTATGTADLGPDYTLAITHLDDRGNVVGIVSDPFTDTGGVFQLPDGASTAVFTITPIADADDEENENVVITITNVAFANTAPPPPPPPLPVVLPLS